MLIVAEDTPKEFANFESSIGFRKGGWANYLQYRARNASTHWVPLPPDEKRPTEIKFYSLNATYENTTDAPGYRISTSRLYFNHHTGLNDIETTHIPYDAWGREGNHKIDCCGMHYLRRHGAKAIRTLEGSPLEEYLEEYDTKNYCMFLNVYFQGLRETMRPFMECGDFETGFSAIQVNLRENDRDLPETRNISVLSHYIENKQDVYSTDAIVMRIENDQVSLKKTTELLKNGIEVFEVMRVAMTGPLDGKVIELYGAKKGMFAGKKKQNPEMYQAWENLFKFAPKTQTLELV